jgi:hypothetical protein
VIEMKKQIQLLIFALLLAACAPQAPISGTGGSAGQPVSWWDAPLPGTIVDSELPAVQLVSHHSDTSGIAEIELTVNDEILVPVPGPPETEKLITDTREWTPPGPGEYTLRVRAKNNNGQWSNYAETYIIVPNIEDLLPNAESTGIVEGVVFAGLSQSPLDGVQVTLKGCGPVQIQITAADGAFNFSGLPAGSCLVSVLKQDWGFISYIPDVIVASSDTFSTQYPISIVSDPIQVTLLSIIMDLTNPFPEQQAGFSDKGLDTNLVYTGSCSPNQVNIAVRAVHPDGIRTVTFFHHLTSPDGDTTPWSNGEAMSPAGGDYFALLQTGDHLHADSGFSQAIVSYQFVIEPVGGSSADFVRSEVFTDLTLVACGREPSGPSPTPAPPEPIATPHPCEPWPGCWIPK